MIRVLTLALLLSIAVPALAAPALPPPADLDRRVGFDQRIGATVAMHMPLQDQHGATTTLATLSHGKPLLLALGYYDCPNLCDAVLHGIGNTVAAMPLHVDRDYAVAFLSIDPRETATDAANAVRRLAQAQPSAEVDRWNLLTAPSPTIRALADTIGYRYFLDPRNQQFNHPAGIVVVTADGKVAQYFLGVGYPPASVRKALVDASTDRLGEKIEQFVMLCCGYDPTTGRYSLLVTRLLQLVGVGFVVLMALGWSRLQSRRRA